MTKQREFIPKGLAERLSVNFFYSSLMRLTSRDFSKLEEKKYISGCMRDSDDKLYLPLKIKSCTPLQAYLLEFNFGYKRLE